ncbi:MAG: hypothetical protein ACTSX1_07185 [Candidatus Heimdallarchaeaceae archaeon]
MIEWWNVLVVLFLLCFLFGYFIPFLRLRKRIILYQNYKNIKPLLDDSKDIAYVTIFNNHVVSEIINGTKLSSTQLNNLSKTYIKNLFDMIGPNIVSDLCIIYSTKENLISLLMNEFIVNIVKDEISKHGNIVEQPNIAEDEEKLVT